MAHVSRLSDVVIPAEVAVSVQEGLAVQIAGDGDHGLPRLTLAASGARVNVFIAFVPPDQFSRPTENTMYTAPWYNQMSDSYNEPVTTRTVYEVGKSTLRNPTMASGELCQAHRGGTYMVPSGTFVDAGNIRVKGTRIKVGANGQWAETSSDSDAVGFSEGFDTVDQVLILTLSQ